MVNHLVTKRLVVKRLSLVHGHKKRLNTSLCTNYCTVFSTGTTSVIVSLRPPTKKFWKNAVAPRTFIGLVSASIGTFAVDLHSSAWTRFFRDWANSMRFWRSIMKPAPNTMSLTRTRPGENAWQRAKIRYFPYFHDSFLTNLIKNGKQTVSERRRSERRSERRS